MNSNPPSTALAALQDPEPALVVSDLVAPETIGLMFRAAILVVVGLPLLYAGSRWIRARITMMSTAQRGMVAGKLFFYAASIVLLVTVFGQLGFTLAPLLGAAGILGIAIGFASQTSVSNIISGLFLIAEQPFSVDDVIQIGDTSGRVMSIDTLSVKLRTFDNKFVRIPNENIIRNQVTTITRFPIRRVDLDIGIAYKEDVARAREILLEVAHTNPIALVEPAPAVNFIGFGDSSVDLRLVAWATRENWLKLKNALLEEIKARFDAEEIEIPFPHRTLYAGEATRPFPVLAVSHPNGADSAEADRSAPENAPDPTREDAESLDTLESPS